MWLQVAFEASQSRQQSDEQRQTVSNNGPSQKVETEKNFLQIWPKCHTEPASEHSKLRFVDNAQWQM